MGFHRPMGHARVMQRGGRCRLIDARGAVMRNRVPHSLEMEMESTRIDVDARVVAGFPLV